MILIEKKDTHLTKPAPMEIKCRRCESRLLVEHVEWVFKLNNKSKGSYYISCINCNNDIEKPVLRGSISCA